MVRGLDSLERVLVRAATEMDEAALHLALADKYLKRWREAGAGRGDRTRPEKPVPAKTASAAPADPLITVELTLSVWKKLLLRLGIDSDLPLSEIRKRIEGLV